MKLITPSYKIVEQAPGMDGLFEAIEQAGRTCYKSEDKITPTSAKDFVDRMVKSKHYAMLEFGTVFLTAYDYEHNNLLSRYINNKYSKSSRSHYYECNYISTNFRVLVENGWLDDLKYLSEFVPNYHEKRICVKFTTDRGVSHELVRHRVFSFAQESTRYCNYSKDKFGNELTFIVPTWINEEYLNLPKNKELNCSYKSEDDFVISLMNTECTYFDMLKNGLTPQQARQVLPNALKTEINMCGFVSDWEHFFELRCNKSTVHPDMYKLAHALYLDMLERGYVHAIGNLE